MEAANPARLSALQQRIDRALREQVPQSPVTFSEYAPVGAAELETDLVSAAQRAGIDAVEGVEALLDRAEALAKGEDPGRLRYALSVVLTHLPIVAALGLRLPSLEARAPWKIAPSDR